MKYQTGSLRFTLGLLGLLGVAGAADQSPLTVGMIPQALAFTALSAWGVARMHHGPLLRRLGQGKAERRQLIFERAGGRA